MALAMIWTSSWLPRILRFVALPTSQAAMEVTRTLPSRFKPSSLRGLAEELIAAISRGQEASAWRDRRKKICLIS